MADNRDDINRDKNMDAGNRGEQDQQGQRTPGRDLDDDLSTGRQGGVQGSQREDRDREQPGSKQRDQNQ